MLWNFIKILLCLLIVQINFAQVKTITQTGVKRSMIRGDATTLTWTVSDDCSLDSLLFIAKDNNGDAVLRMTTGGSLSTSYKKPNTTITATINAATTENFIAQGYLYDITNVTDSVTLIMGLLTVVADVSNLEDTVLTPIPYYTVALDTPNVANTFLIGQDSTNVWYRRTKDETRTILGIDTMTSAGSLPDSIIYTSELGDTAQALRTRDDSLFTKTSHIVKIEEYIGALDTSLGWSLVIQAAIDANLGTGNTLLFNENKVYELQYQKADPYNTGYRTCLDLKTGGFGLVIPPTTTLKLKDDQMTGTTNGVNIVTFRNAEDLYIGGGGRITGNTIGQPDWAAGYSQGDPSIIRGRATTHTSILNFRITIENLRLDDHWGCPINIAGVDNIIMKNLFNYGTGEGFQLITSKNILIDNLSVNDSTDTYEGDGIELSNCEYFTISNSSVENGGVTAGTAYDIYGSREGTVINPYIDDWATGGIAITFGINGVSSDNIMVSGGIIKGSTISTGIYINTNGGTVILENIYFDSVSIGVQFYNSTDENEDVAFMNGLVFDNLPSTSIIQTGNTEMYLANSQFINCGGGIYIGNNVSYTNNIPTIHLSNSTFKNNTTAITINNSGDDEWFPLGTMDRSIFINNNDDYALVDYNVADSILIDGGNFIDMEGKTYYNFGKINISGLPNGTTGLNAGDVYIDEETGILYSAMGANIVLNGDFDEWDGEPLLRRSPTYWQNNEPDTNHAYLVNDNDRLRFISDGSVPLFLVYTNTAYQGSADVGEDYWYSFDVISWEGDSMLVYFCGENINPGYASLEVGNYTGLVTATANLRYMELMTFTDTADVIIDNVKVWRRTGGDITSGGDVIGDKIQLFIDTLYRSNDTIYFVQEDGSKLFFVDQNDGGGLDTSEVKGIIYEYLEDSSATSDYTQEEMDSLLALAGGAGSIYYDTLFYTWGIMDTTTVGALPGWKVPNNITITEISAYTDANTCTFNLEERAETTPNTAGTDVMSSDLVADNDQQEQTSFSNAAIDRNDWLVPTISATGDVSIFSITVRYVKTN